MALTPVLLLLLAYCLSGVSSSAGPPPRSFTSLFALGDSYIDAGNFVTMATPVAPVWVDKPPYGMTFFERPTGRFSDGRVIVDFVAAALGVPFLPASLANSSDDDDARGRGVNFAVGGATAVDVAFFERRRLVPFKLLNNSLDVQLGWFEELEPSLCNATAESSYGGGRCFSRSLFLVGEFGVNDYTFLWTANKTESEVMAFVPRVVRTIAAAVERLIVRDGAAHVVVPGNPPIGCSPTLLTLLRRTSRPTSAADDDDYDHIGCLRGVNDVARHHNALLGAAVVGLRARHPRATIVFADFYTPIRRILENPNQFGVVVSDVLKACCGTGGAYNWNGSAVCGMPGVPACANPSAYVSWDGVHFTEAVNRYVAEGWLYGPYAHPPILKAMRRP